MRAPPMSMSMSMAKGFFRDKMALFFAIVFPLMFLVLFGGLLTNPGSSKSDIIQVGPVSVLDQAPAASKKVLEDSLDITRSTDATAALLKVRKGDADAMIEQQGKTIIVHYSQADPVKSAIVQGTFQAVVQSANIQASGMPPTFSLDTKQVEDDSLSTIQFVTPGLLGRAIAMGATFGAATNLHVFGRPRPCRSQPDHRDDADSDFPRHRYGVLPARRCTDLASGGGQCLAVEASKRRHAQHHGAWGWACA